ncbi:MAG: hypothetical protein AAF383_04300 [Cyanobacteria bacterium P01_A01_bin.83]
MTQVSSFNIGQNEVRGVYLTANQNNSVQISAIENDIRKFGVSKVSTTETDVTQISIFQFDSNEISFASSISSEQFFSIHDATPQIINELNNSATKIWSDLLQSETQVDIDFQITDLPSGQLAEAAITDFDDLGVPNAGTILINHDANGVAWFVDETPLDNRILNICRVGRFEN